MFIECSCFLKIHVFGWRSEKSIFVTHFLACEGGVDGFSGMLIHVGGCMVLFRDFDGCRGTFEELTPFRAHHGKKIRGYLL